MSDGVYVRGKWEPLPEDNAELSYEKGPRKHRFIWAALCFCLAVAGLMLARRKTRRNRRARA